MIRTRLPFQYTLFLDAYDAVMTMSQPSHSVIMPKLPQITVFWNESAPLLSGVYDHKVKPDQYRAKLAKLQKDISKK